MATLDMSARDEARNLGLSGVVTGLSSSVDEGGEPRCGCRWPHQGATGGVGGAHIQRAGLTDGAGYRFAEPGAAQAHTDRVNVLLRLKHGSVVGVAPPQPGVVDLRRAECEPSLSCI